MFKVYIFSSRSSYVSGILLRGMQTAVEPRSDVEIAALVTDPGQDYVGSYRRDLIHKSLFSMKARTMRTPNRFFKYPRPLQIRQWANRDNVEIIYPVSRDINDPVFIDRLAKDPHPKIAFSIFCMQKFSPELLGVFTHAVNYHNGLLPGYKGLKATHWSMYQGESETGFTLHYMTDQLDGGPLLASGHVDILPGHTAYALEVEKANRAVTLFPELINNVIAGNPGVPQAGDGSYFGGEAYRRITMVKDPATLSAEELLKRLRIFGNLHLRLQGEWHSINSLRVVRENERSSNRLYFSSADNIAMEASRRSRGFDRLSQLIDRAGRWRAKGRTD